MNGRRFTGKLILCLILILFLVFVPEFFDLNRYQPELKGWLKLKTGRDIDFSGQIMWTLFPEASLTVEGLTVANPPGFEGRPLLAVNRVEIALAGLPLLKRKFAIKRLLVDGCTLNIITDSHGEGNWQQLASSDQTAPADFGLPENNAVKPWLSAMTSLDELIVTHGQISWENRKTGDSLLFKNIYGKIDKAQNERRLHMVLETAISKPASSLPAVIKFSSEIRHEDSGLRWLLDNSRLQMADITSLLPYHLPSFSAVADQSSFESGQESLTVRMLQVDAGDFRLAANDLKVMHILSEPEIQASAEIVALKPKAIMKQFGIDPGKLKGDALSSAAAGFNIQAGRNRLEVKNLILTLDDAQISGWISLENFNKPAIKFSFQADQLELDRYLPPSHSINGVSPNFAELSPVPLFTLPLDKLKALQANGELKVANIKFRGITMHDVNWQIQSNQGKVAVVQATGN